MRHQPFLELAVLPVAVLVAADDGLQGGLPLGQLGGQLRLLLPLGGHHFPQPQQVLLVLQRDCGLVLLVLEPGGEHLLDAGLDDCAVLAVLLFRVQDALQQPLLALQRLLLPPQPLHVLQEVLVLAPERRLLLAAPSVAQVVRLQRVLQSRLLLSQLVAPLSLHAHRLHQPGELFLLRLQALPQPPLVLLVGLEQAGLEPRQVAEELVLAAPEPAVELLVVLLEVASLLLALGQRLVPARNGFLEHLVGLPAPLRQLLVVVPQFLHLDLQLLPADQQPLVLQVLLTDLVLSDDRGQRPRKGVLGSLRGLLVYG